MVTGVFFLPYCLCIDIPFLEEAGPISADSSICQHRTEVMMAPGGTE